MTPLQKQQFRCRWKKLFLCVPLCFLRVSVLKELDLAGNIPGFDRAGLNDLGIDAAQM